MLTGVIQIFKFKQFGFDQRGFGSHNVQRYSHNRHIAATLVVEHTEKQHLKKKTYEERDIYGGRMPKRRSSAFGKSQPIIFFS